MLSNIIDKDLWKTDYFQINSPLFLKFFLGCPLDLALMPTKKLLNKKSAVCKVNTDGNIFLASKTLKPVLCLFL